MWRRRRRHCSRWQTIARWELTEYNKPFTPRDNRRDSAEHTCSPMKRTFGGVLWMRTTYVAERIFLSLSAQPEADFKTEIIEQGSYCVLIFPTQKDPGWLSTGLMRRSVISYVTLMFGILPVRNVTVELWTHWERMSVASRRMGLRSGYDFKHSDLCSLS